MKCIESYGMQWNPENPMECNEINRIQWNPMNFTWFCVHWHWFWCLSGLSEASRGVSGRSTGALRGHLTIFDKYVENSKIWITSFWGLLEQMRNIAQVLLMFLKSHNEAQFEPCCKSALFIIHLRGKLQCFFIDFHVFANQKKSSDFRSESLCVVLNACLTCQNWASRGDFWYFKMRICLFLLHTDADVNNSYEAAWRPLGRNYQY